MSTPAGAKIHLAVAEEQAFGIYWTGTLCGRSSLKGEDGEEANSTVDHSLVTCKLCLRLMGDKLHWRHRRYISKTIKQTRSTLW